MTRQEHASMHDRDAIIRPLDLPSLTALRLYKPSPDHIRQASRALGFELAGPPNTFTAGPAKTARLAPAEWLVTQGPPMHEIAARLAGILHHASDIRPGKHRQHGVEGVKLATAKLNGEVQERRGYSSQAAVRRVEYRYNVSVRLYGEASLAVFSEEHTHPSVVFHRVHVHRRPVRGGVFCP
jgi:hypothetical protein